ncbi:hypothetical protein GDO78_019901 [Eleutherodactylus coqui]|uniref:Uncharacterized protein n=1 Tax=Eleutherodactylus coqui TaxID=57060 RepID=A0A8J6B7A3_ELECQ|nr:hypothetical protein GDO78_019901 [Eleutherodactylus coqui]
MGSLQGILGACGYMLHVNARPFQTTHVSDPQSPLVDKWPTPDACEELTPNYTGPSFPAVLCTTDQA